MNKQDKVKIQKLTTGVQGLDEILGGGLPEYSFNIIGGPPGSGKTTLAHQIVFANASIEKPALYFTVLGEPAVKMLRYQQQFDFFDMRKHSTAIRFVNLSELAAKKDLNAVIDEIVAQVTAFHPGVVVVDSFRSVMSATKSYIPDGDLLGFIQRLALHLTSWQATTFLIGEYSDKELQNNPVFTVADGIVWLSQQAERNSIVRKLQIMKMRGQESVPGFHTIRITQAGVQAYPRNFGLSAGLKKAQGERRLSTGIKKLDVMMGGGIPEGDSVLLAGASGTGKSLIGSQFIAEGLRTGEPGIVVVFEELPEGYVHRAAKMGLDLTTPQKEGLLKIIYTRPLDLSVDEIMHEIAFAVQEVGAKRLVIDSIAGFELALAPAFRTDFRESLYRMISGFTRLGVTVVSTVEVQSNFGSFDFSNYSISFLADDIVRLSYVSIQGQLRKMLAVVKMRGSGHSVDLHEYVISPNEGLSIGEVLRGYSGLTTGSPRPWGEGNSGLSDLVDDTEVNP